MLSHLNNTTLQIFLLPVTFIFNKYAEVVFLVLLIRPFRRDSAVRAELYKAWRNQRFDGRNLWYSWTVYSSQWENDWYLKWHQTWTYNTIVLGHSAGAYVCMLALCVNLWHQSFFDQKALLNNNNFGANFYMHVWFKRFWHKSPFRSIHGFIL